MCGNLTAKTVILRLLACQDVFSSSSFKEASRWMINSGSAKKIIDVIFRRRVATPWSSPERSGLVRPGVVKPKSLLWRAGANDTGIHHRPADMRKISAL